MKKFNMTIIAIILSQFSLSVSAEVAKRDAGAANAAKYQTMLRDVSSERDTLKTENASLQKKIDDLQKQLSNLKTEKTKLSSKINNADKTIDKYNEVNEKLRERINKDRERTLELIAKFKETVITLKQVEMQRSKLETESVNLTQEMNVCANKNAELYQTNLELVELYKDKSVWDAMLQKEPVTQLGRVEIENIGQQYVNKMQESRFASNITE